MATPQEMYMAELLRRGGAPNQPLVRPYTGVPTAPNLNVQTAPVGMDFPPEAAPAAASQGPNQWDMANTQVPKDIMPGPPKTPEERDRRVSGWRALVDRLQKDPALMGMFFKVGTQLMQPVQPGQTPLGHLGQALQSGADYTVQAREMQRRAGLESRREGREERRDVREERALTSDIESQRVQRETQQAEEGRREGKYDKELSMIDKQMRAADSADKMATAEITAAEWKLKNKEKYTAVEFAQMQATLDKTRAETKALGRKGATEAEAKDVRDREGASRAVAKFERMIKVENDRVNQGKTGKDRVAYETTRQRVLSDMPGSFQSWMKAETSAGGGTADLEAPAAAATPEVFAQPGRLAKPGEILTKEYLQWLRATQGSKVAPAPPRVGIQGGSVK